MASQTTTTTTPPPPRLVTVAAAQLGPNHFDTPRAAVLDRMLALMDAAAARGVRLLAFPELALTTFFPVRYYEPGDAAEQAELAGLFEPASAARPFAVLDDGGNAAPLVERARKHGMDFYLGYAERWEEEEEAEGKEGKEKKKTTDYNASLYYSAAEDRAIAKYRKVHLPGSVEPPPPEANSFKQLEKRYFAPGDLGFQAFRAPGLVDNALKAEDYDGPADDGAGGFDPRGRGDPIVGMLLCNDRRWPEAWRPYGLQGAELVVEGFNTTAWAPQYAGSPAEQTAEAEHAHRLSAMAGSYQNACWGLHAAKCGEENGQWMIGGSMIVDPDGHVVAENQTLGDELVAATIDLARCRRQKERVFDFGRHRRPEHYGIMVEQVGAREIPLLSRSD
ncbi:carbon-nitrogen hydrolase [Xylariaceae sp. FL0804]|nr:carbon-nitrogen hydrolase [Xylariaceae sp. FL0804]